MRLPRPALFIALAVGVGLLARASGSHFAGPALASGPKFQCNLDASCPTVTLTGDPEATLGGNSAPFRGYGDPSLERDPATGAIWMSYSWLDVLVSSPGPPRVVDLGVRTHLARSDDGGQTFTFVRALNSTDQIVHPDTNAQGWTMHEVSTIAPTAGGWEALWLNYFDPLGTTPGGPDGHSDFYYARSLGDSPADLGDSSEPWIDGYLTSPSFGVANDLSSIPQLDDCATFTEPALLAYGGNTYLATNCVVIVNGVRAPDQERLVLLREDSGGYTYLGSLLDYADAQDNGGERIEQADLSVAQNGAVLLIATPTKDSQPNHLGCRVFEVTSLDSAQVLRDGSGKATVLMSVTGDPSDSEIGPGLCTYDAASATGLVFVEHVGTTTPLNLDFSMRATGLHPQGVDSDADGVADSVDNCPAWPNPAQTPPSWLVPAGDGDCDGFSSSLETFIGTDPASPCGVDAWPADLNNDQAVNLSDIFLIVPHLNTFDADPGSSPRFDLNGDSAINLSDIFKVVPFLNQPCSP